MSSEEHLEILSRGVDAWNNWRRQNPSIKVSLTGAEFYGSSLVDPRLAPNKLKGMRISWFMSLSEADLSGADLSRAKFLHSDLRGANFTGAMLADARFHGSDLTKANLSEADLTGANLAGTDLTGANLLGATLTAANLHEADLTNVKLGRVASLFFGLLETSLDAVNLSTCKGLNDCQHIGSVCVDHRTIACSKNVPLSFWRGCGLPDRLIEYIPSLTKEAIQMYSCFISYSSKDQAFADRLHADLQDNGVRCWFAPHDLPIGAKTWDGIDEAIRTRDKVLLILSRSAIASDWVEDEVTKAFAEERRRKGLILFPVRLDHAVMKTNEPWAGKLRDNRNIGDFTNWKDHDAYQESFNRVLKDLKVNP